MRRRVVTGLVAAASLASVTPSAVGLTAHSAELSPVRYRCADDLKTPPPTATVRLYSPHRRHHVVLNTGQSLVVITHDRSYLGVMAAEQKPRSHVPCQARESGSKHRKVVRFLALHRGKMYVSASPRVAPGLGAAYA